GIASGMPRKVVAGSAADMPVSVRGRRCQRVNARRFSANVSSSSAPPSMYARTSGGSSARAVTTASSRTANCPASGAGAFIEPRAGCIPGSWEDLVQQRPSGPVAAEVLDEELGGARMPPEPTGRGVWRQHDAGMVPKGAVDVQRLAGEHVED